MASSDHRYPEGSYYQLPAGITWESLARLRRRADASPTHALLATAPGVAAWGVLLPNDCKSTAPSFDEARDICNALGLTLTRNNFSSTGEYRLNIMGGRESTAYYTPDLADAIGTARDVASRLTIAATVSA